MDSKFDQSLIMLPDSYYSHYYQQRIVMVKKRTIIEEVILFWQFMTGNHKIYKQYKVLVK